MRLTALAASCPARCRVAPRDTAHRRARPCGARCASGPVRPGPARPRYERCGPRSSGASARRRLPRSVARRFRARGARPPRVCPSTARNALVIATEILLASNFETVPLRRITCIGGALSGEAERFGTQREKGSGFGFARNEFEKIATSADPVVLLGLDVWRRRCIECAAAKRRHESASDRRTPRPWTFFGVAAGLLARRSALFPVFPMRSRISDVKSGTTHCLQLRGQRRILAQSRDTPASLLATSC